MADKDWKEIVKARIKYILAFLGGVVSDAVRQAVTEELVALINVLKGVLGI